jgi:hypothetical protein
MVDLTAKVDPKSEAVALEIADPYIKSWAQVLEAALGQAVQGLKEAGSSLHLTVEIKITGLYPDKKPSTEMPDAPIPKT